MFGSLAFLPFGLAIVGPIAHALGTKTTIVAATTLLVALLTATLAVPSVRNMRAPTLPTLGTE
jgi:hypothetical protein